MLSEYKLTYSDIRISASGAGAEVRPQFKHVSRLSPKRAIKPGCARSRSGQTRHVNQPIR